MEIIIELIVQVLIEYIPLLFELLIGTIGEMVVQVFGQALFELGLHGLVEAFDRKKQRHPFLAVVGYGLWGAILGGLSLFVLPHSLIQKSALKWFNLICSPVAAGLVMAGIGALRRRRGQYLLRLDSFSYGFLFAMGMAIIRCWLAD